MATPHTPDPQDARRAREATDETSGVASDGDTPPAEGAGVGPDNPGMDVEQTGERSAGKIVLGLIIALVVIGVLLFILGRVAGLG
ncbi:MULTISPECIES: DUF6480 family protein [Micrococcus]|uniref:DUF6480 family protein n=1 Tax=Micrococcus TaxID=1269 RepID=UPI0024AFDA73|nr:DUF6480 family protein [Micrococcus yunnanensis]WHM16147.1 DUF6480 family protein [Micrococcus yunnanensis]